MAMRKKILYILLLATSLCGLLSAGAVSRKQAEADKRHKLRPLDAPFSFVATPGEKRIYHFTTTILPDGESYIWETTDLTGKKKGISGRAVIRNRRLSIGITLTSGFYELRFPELDQTFGISVLPPFSGKNDPFFAIEGLLENSSPEIYRSCLRLLARSGIHHNREWTNFHLLTSRNSYDSRNDPFYRYAGMEKIDSIFAFHDFPEWANGIFTGRRKSLPGKLIGVDSMISKMIDSRRSGLEGFQILNEYDQVNIPAEACLPPLKLAAWIMRNRKLTLVGAAFCKGSSLSCRDSIASGMLDFIDVFSIHTYSEPERMISYVEEYRKDMAGHPKGQLPIWVTESGKPWKRGLTQSLERPHGGPLNNLHPQPDEDMTSALWITMKAVEAKACGVARYYPFAMRFFQENNYNFGMLDYYNTPLRSMHAYSFLVKLLSGLEYRGDWKHKQVDVHPIRIFSDNKKVVAVFYIGKDGIAKHSISLEGFPSGTGYAIDGSRLHPGNNRLSFYGGMAYWVFPAEQLSPTMLNTDTKPMRMFLAAKAYQPIPRYHTPLIYRYDFLRSGTEWRNNMGYYLPENGRLHFIIANLSDQTLITRPHLTLPRGVAVIQPPPELLKLPARSETRLTIGIGRGCSSYRYNISLGDAQNKLSATTVPLFDFSQLKPEKYEFTNIGRWHHNSSGTQTIRISDKGETIEVYTDFRKKHNPPGNNWSFPEFRFKPEEKRGKLRAVSFDFRYDNPENKRRPLFPCVQLSYYGRQYEAYPINTPQHIWKHYIIPVSGLNETPYDLLRIGMGTDGDVLAFQFRNLKLWFE